MAVLTSVRTVMLGERVASASTPEISSQNPIPKRSKLKVVLAALSLISILYPITDLHQMRTPDSVLHSETKPQIASMIAPIQAQDENQALPVRLTISRINVQASIEYVGVSPEGQMEVPQDTMNVGWLDVGTRPGEKGSAAIAGHANDEHGEKGVFSDLNQLQVGDTLSTEDSQGEVINFVVRKIAVYDPGYADEVFSRNDGSYLNLITCDGVWDEAKKSYSKRLVVFTERVE